MMRMLKEEILLGIHHVGIKTQRKGILFCDFSTYLERQYLICVKKPFFFSGENSP